MNDEIDSLELAIKKKIDGLPKAKKYRCHEIARILTDWFRKNGYKARAKDGIVLYDYLFLTNNLAKGINSEVPHEEGMSVDEIKNSEEEAMSKDQFLAEGDEGFKKYFAVVHSWCEIDLGPDGIFMVDWHNELTVKGRGKTEIVFPKLPILGRKKNLPFNYIEGSIRIGRLITLIPYPYYPYLMFIILRKGSPL
jgi:hypothetical protein